MASEVLIVRTAQEADELTRKVRSAADRLRASISALEGDGAALLRALKFEAIGTHPIHGHALNPIEQVNQTWTYLVALAAAHQLLALHPGAGGLLIAPGAHAAQELDIMSVEPGVVGAEVFAAVDPNNNRKLARDLAKLADRTEQHRYVFFASPRYPEAAHQPVLDRHGVQVWSVHV